MIPVPVISQSTSERRVLRTVGDRVQKMNSLLLLCAVLLGSHELSLVADAALLSKVTPWGDNSARVQISAPGASVISAPILSPIGDAPPASSTVAAAGAAASEFGSSVVSGNLKVEVTGDGMITATRVSDGAVLLKQTGLSWSAATNGSAPGSVSVSVTFHRDPEKPDSIYGRATRHSLPLLCCPVVYTPSAHLIAICALPQSANTKTAKCSAHHTQRSSQTLCSMGTRR